MIRQRSVERPRMIEEGRTAPGRSRDPLWLITLSIQLDRSSIGTDTGGHLKTGSTNAVPSLVIPVLRSLPTMQADQGSRLIEIRPFPSQDVYDTGWVAMVGPSEHSIAATRTSEQHFPQRGSVGWHRFQTSPLRDIHIVCERRRCTESGRILWECHQRHRQDSRELFRPKNEPCPPSHLTKEGTKRGNRILDSETAVIPDCRMDQAGYSSLRILDA